MNRNERVLRVLVGGHDQKFWFPLQRHLEQTGLFEFKEDPWRDHNDHDRERSLELLSWADVIVAEWTLGNAVFYSRHKAPHQRLVTRLHLQERETPYPAEIDYSQVDAVVFVGEHILEECVSKFRIPREKAIVIGNFAETGRFDRPKIEGAEFNLGLIGTVPRRKRLDLAVDTLALLLEHDERYTLHVKGANPASYPWLMARKFERDYYERLYTQINQSELRGKIVFDPPGNDVPEWLQGIGYVLSPSDYESFHMAVAEGMSAGSLPITWRWCGAERIYRELPLVDSACAAAEMILRLSSSSEAARLRDQCKKYIAMNFDRNTVSGLWQDILTDGSALREHVPALAHRSSGTHVLVVWAIDNWTTFHRKEMIQALSKSLEGDFEVLVIEPGAHPQTITALGWASEDELKRMACGELIKISDHLHRTRLFSSPVPAGWESQCGQGSRAPFAVLTELVDRNYGGSASILHWVYKPDQAAKLPAGHRFVYEIYDDYTMDFGTGQLLESVAEMEDQILPRAEHVFFTSAPLFDRKANKSRSSSIVGNGVNYPAFEKTRVERTVGHGRPVAGYLGNLSIFFDWALMSDICGVMRHVDFMFHGQVEEDKLGEKALAHYGKLRRLTNVHFTGRVTREWGAAAINRYDVLLIPFVVNDAMHAVNPLKLWEYFATGLPVISSSMAAIYVQEPLIRFAHDPQQWISCIEAAIAEEGDQTRNERIRLAEAHSWRQIVEEHASILRKLKTDRATQWPASGAPQISKSRLQ